MGSEGGLVCRKMAMRVSKVPQGRLVEMEHPGVNRLGLMNFSWFQG